MNRFIHPWEDTNWIHTFYYWNLVEVSQIKLNIVHYASRHIDTNTTKKSYGTSTSTQ